MARRRPAAYALAALTLTVSGCAAAHAGTNSAWHRPTKIDASSVPPTGSPSPSSSPSPTQRPTAPKSPTATSSQSGSSTLAPSSSTPRNRGPAGSLTGTGSDAVALTFDDGPDVYSMAFLDLLAKQHVKATFCVIGKHVAEYPDVIRRIVADGHTLCNHTWSHDIGLKTRTPDQIRAEMQRTNDAIHAIVPGVPIKYFRNPGGTGPGAIVLMHDGGGDRSATLVALRTILPNLAGRFHLIALPT